MERLAADRHLLLLHGLEQRSLRFRRRPVDFVGQDQIGEDRARNEFELTPTRTSIFFDDLGPGDVGGHQIGRELDAFEGEAQGLRDGPYQQRLRQARQAGDQAVSAYEYGDQDLLDDLVLPHDDFAELVEDLLLRTEEVFNLFCDACVSNFTGCRHAFSRKG